MHKDQFIVAQDKPVLVTGASGFIGPAVVDSLARHGLRHIRALVRASSDLKRLTAVVERHRETARIDVIMGNLLSRADCSTLTKGAGVIYHLATGGGKSFPESYRHSVVTTRNLLDASLQHGCLKRFVNVSSLAVYANTSGRVLDENTPVEAPADRRGDAYTFAKIKQDELVIEYGQNLDVPYVIVRPGSVYGPGKESFSGRVGIDTFGVFLHLGGSNRIPFTYIDNCADAITLAGLTPGVDRRVYNIVDDDLPSSRQFLRLYKQHVRPFRSVYIPHAVSYCLSWAWEKCARWSRGQLPPAFNRSRWHAEWKKTRYVNQKAKAELGWVPRVPMADGMRRYFDACREARLA